MDRYLRKVRGESDVRKSSLSESLPGKPTFRLVYQPKVVSQDDNDDTKENNDVEEENEAECLTHSKMKMGSDIVILMHGVKATGRNWIGLYRVDEPDEFAGNRVMCIPAIPGTETYKKQQQMKADMAYPKEVREALVLQRQHVAHFVPQIQAGKKLHPRRIKKCDYRTHNGVSAIVVTQPNVNSVVVPGSTFDIRWVAAPYVTVLILLRPPFIFSLFHSDTQRWHSATTSSLRLLFNEEVPMFELRFMQRNQWIF